jgi:phosphoglycerate dehydrogenase-like enzyme
MGNNDSILVLARENDPQLAMLNGLPHVVGNHAAAFDGATADAAVILNWTGSRELLRSVFMASPQVRWVHSRSAGLDSTLFPELVESNIPLTNSKGVFSPSLGEFALAAILYFAKDFRRMLRNQAAGVWAPFDVEEIAGQTVGIVGYGDIGRAIATRVHAMGMRVLATKRHLPDAADPLAVDPLIEQFYRTEARCEMIARCDYIVVAAPLTNETRHMIADAEFAAMKSSAVIINVGRGPVIDERPMLHALTAGKIKGAGLDVFETEPLPPGHPIYRLENVLLSPHCADNTPEWTNQAMRFFLDQYQRFELGQPLQNIVDKKRGY